MTKFKRQFSVSDRLIALLDDALTTVHGNPPRLRPVPGSRPVLSKDTSNPILSAQLMRVNHSGEVCAQALYQAQAVTARSKRVRKTMERAAQEENDHLNWCAQRLVELDSRKSYLNPVWYCGSFVIGTVFGVIGDRWNLGFLAETERQVVKHLDRHMQRLPEDDDRSREILKQMKDDEACHATHATEAGARELPDPVKRLMTMTSKIMTTIAARI